MGPRRKRFRRAVAGIAAATTCLLAAGALAACGSPGPAPSPSRSTPAAASSTPTPPTPAPTASATATPVTPGVVAEGLEVPWSLAFHDGTALFSERDSARIRELSPSGSIHDVGVVDGVTPRGEGGLLGIAVRDGFLYAMSTADDGNRVQRFRLDGAPGALSLGPAESILAGLPAAAVHNGGRIAFGPDGMLYVTAGDAGDPSRAQDLTSLGGKILRITPDGQVPPDNPFPGSPVYSYGHRNPQGLAWSADGTLYASEFGQDTWDELNVITPGADYGWPEAEGIAGIEGFVDPVQQWPTDAASPSGIAIVGDTLFLANLRGERLRRVPLSDPSSSSEEHVGEFGRLRDVVDAGGGAIWILTNNTDGRGDPREGDDRIVRLPAD
ncbi:PQQ-dependent sugar dehydrogenase [Microbacterium resistens]|uniref:PQQ-dependent sugar dehydrogenase n=1 Tax=Microbacterium resistens TaxID=156977 RepID=UPI00366C7CA7